MFLLFQAPMPFYAGDPNRFTTTWQTDPSQGKIYVNKEKSLLILIYVATEFTLPPFSSQAGKTNSSSNFQHKQDKLRWTIRATTQPTPHLRIINQTQHTPFRTSLPPLTSPIIPITRLGFNQFPRRGPHLTAVPTPPSQAQELPITPQNISSNMHNKPPLQEQPRETTPDRLQLRLIKTPYPHQLHQSTPSTNRITKETSTQLKIPKNTTILMTERTVQETQTMKETDRSRTRRMDSIRETPSLDTCRGATVRELH